LTTGQIRDRHAYGSDFSLLEGTSAAAAHCKNLQQAQTLLSSLRNTVSSLLYYQGGDPDPSNITMRSNIPRWGIRGLCPLLYPWLLWSGKIMQQSVVIGAILVLF
jgi:hypothetical protein